MNEEESHAKYKLWETLVRKVAKFVARDFPETEEEDLFQELMMFVLTTDALTDPTAQYMSSNLTNMANKIGWANRKEALYVTAQYAYRTSDVKKILETLFEYEEWFDTFLPGDAESMCHDDRLAQNSDLLYAYDKLGKNYQGVIYRRYVYREMPTNDTERKRLARAIERMTDLLNIYRGKTHDGVGRRTVISNAMARYIISEQS